MKYMVDLDGVLAEFNRSFAAQLGVPTIPLDDKSWPTKWDWPEDYASPEQLAEVWNTVRASKHFWEDLPAFPWTGEALELLHAEALDGEEVYFVTSREGGDIKRQTERWLSKYGFPEATVLVSTQGDKAGIAHDLDADVMIDDRPEVLTKIREWGKDTLRIYLQVHPYNSTFAIRAAEDYRILPVESPVTAIRSEYARREIYQHDCDVCNGAGTIASVGSCPACHGTGKSKLNGNA